MDQLKAKQDLYNGFGETFGRAFEFVATPVLFGALGWFLDRSFGTTPVFMILLVLFCLCGVGAKMYYRYQADIAEQEKDAPWAKRRSSKDPSRPDVSQDQARQDQARQHEAQQEQPRR